MLLSTLCSSELFAQNDGVEAPKESAMNNLYLNPEPWSGSRFAGARPFKERVYINAGFGIGNLWDSRNELNSGGFNTNISMGYRLSPIHALELGLNHSGGYDTKNQFGLDLSYLFDVTAFANRTQDPGKWQLLLKSGIETNITTPALAFSEGVRIQYNVAPIISLYVEPKASIYAAPLYTTSSYSQGYLRSSISMGFSFDIGRISNALYRRRVRIESGDYEATPLLAIKTNLLFDALTLLNIELEVPIGDKWSIAGEWTFPWWIWDNGTVGSRRNRVQMLNGSAELKYWLGDRTNRPVMTGWFAGIYGGGGVYDFEHDKEGYQGEFYIAAGVSGGYAHTINKKGNLRMEYSIGLGYVNTRYRHYIAEYYREDDWRAILQDTGTFSWFGPTKVKASLVWLLNVNRERGARR